MRKSIKSFSKHSLIAIALMAGIGVGCARNKKPDPMDSVSGVILPEHVQLSDSAVAHVRLADVTGGYIQSETVVQKKVRPSDDGTIPFTLSFKESQINKGRTYAVDARIIDRDRVYVIGGKQHPVLTKGHGDTVEMQLDRGAKF